MNSDSPAPIVIPLSKTKIILLGLVSLILAFISSEILLAKEPAPQLHSRRAKARIHSPELKVFGVVGILFSGFCCIYAVGKIVDRKPGLIIDDEGIIDNCSAITAGRIRWDNMTSFTVTTILQGTKILNILVRLPESYLKGKGRLTRLAGATNIKMVGTPIKISSHALKIEFDDLVRLINEACIAHSKRMPRSEDDQADLAQ